MNTAQHLNPNLGSLKRTELLSSVGAGVLGGGIALLLADILSPYSIPILMLGLVAHAVGMAQKHALEQRGGSGGAGWVEAMYWLCWLVLAALFLYILINLF